MKKISMRERSILSTDFSSLIFSAAVGNSRIVYRKGLKTGKIRRAVHKTRTKANRFAKECELLAFRQIIIARAKGIKGV